MLKKWHKCQNAEYDCAPSKTTSLALAIGLREDRCSTWIRYRRFVFGYFGGNMRWPACQI